MEGGTRWFEGRPRKERAADRRPHAARVCRAHRARIGRDRSARAEHRLGGDCGWRGARGGSKGVPGKNVRPIAGRTLLEYAARTARESAVIDRLVLSTDSEEIAD